MGLIARNENQILEKIQNFLSNRSNDWKIGDIEFAGKGADFCVLKATSEKFGKIAIRTPWQRWMSDGIDKDVDTLELLRQERELAQHFQSHNLPIPDIYDLQSEGDIIFLISRFIENDGSLPNTFQLGKITRLIHDAPLKSFKPVFQMEATLEQSLAGHIITHVATISEITNEKFFLPSKAELVERLQWEEGRQKILHMDIRPENFLCNNGNIVGIVDWSNALIGDPCLELARIDESGYLDDSFLEAYGEKDVFCHCPGDTETLYRLYTVTILVLVFYLIAPDPSEASQKLERLKALLARL